MPAAPRDRGIDSIARHRDGAMTMSAILYLPALLAGVLVLVAIASTHAQPVTEAARPAQVAQFCQPQEPTAETFRLFCRSAEG